MFLHIGNREIIAFSSVVGVFNAETVNLSSKNEIYQEEMKESTRSVIIDKDDEVILSEISSMTLIEREILEEKDLLWVKR